MHNSNQRPTWIRIVSFALMIVGTQTSVDSAVASEDTIALAAGELSILVRDNSKSPNVLSGLQSLFNVKHGEGYDAYDPKAIGHSACCALGAESTSRENQDATGAPSRRLP
jgi:hypothetical protein